MIVAHTLWTKYSATEDGTGRGSLLVAHSLRSEYDASKDGPGRGTPLIPSVSPVLTAKMQGSSGWAPYNETAHLIPAVCGTLSDGAHMGGGSTARMPIQAESSRCLNAGGMGRQDWETETFVLERTGGGFDEAIGFVQNQRDEVRAVAGALAAEPGMKQQSYVAMLNMMGSKGNSIAESDAQTSFTLNSMHGHDVHAIAFHNRQDPDVSGDVTHPIGRMDNGLGLGLGMKVRRLTPLECERLQGFPDGWTDVPYRGKPAADGPRYKAVGNSMAVNVMRWIGDRIQQSVERSGG